MTDTEEKSERYIEAVGRRKTAVARVRITKGGKKKEIIINGKPYETYFPILRYQQSIVKPLEVANEDGIAVSVVVRGGGISMQSEAVQLGVARALLALSENSKEMRARLRNAQLLTRDSRKVERKKPGLKKARRAPQWAKR